MGKNFAIAVLIAVALSGIGVAMISLRKHAMSEERSKALSDQWKVTSRELVKAEETIQDLQENLSNLEDDLEETRVRLEHAKGGAGKGAAVAEAKAEGTDNPFAKAMKGFRDDPAMKEMLAKQQEVMVDRMFGPLLENLDLTDEEMAEFRALLVERQVAAMDQGFQLMGGGTSKEERAALTAELAAQQEAVRAEIKEMIGEENFAKFDLYEKSQQERQQITSFKQNLAGTGQELTLEQEEALMSAMYEERTNFKYTTDFSKQDENGADAFANLKPEAVDRFMEETQVLHEAVYERVAEILSPEQLAAFAKSQENFRSMQEFGMKMGLQMMRGEEEKSQSQ